MYIYIYYLSYRSSSTTNSHAKIIAFYHLFEKVEGWGTLYLLSSYIHVYTPPQDKTKNCPIRYYQWAKFTYIYIPYIYTYMYMIWYFGTATTTMFTSPSPPWPTCLLWKKHAGDAFGGTCGRLELCHLGSLGSILRVIAKDWSMALEFVGKSWDQDVFTWYIWIDIYIYIYDVRPLYWR